MINIDENKYLIELTRGDTANIVFSAVHEDGTEYEPQEGDKLKFSVSKKYGGEILFSVENTMEDEEEKFWNIEITPEKTKDMKFADYYFDVQLEVYDANADSYQVVTIIGKTDSMTPKFRLWGEVSE